MPIYSGAQNIYAGHADQHDLALVETCHVAKSKFTLCWLQSILLKFSAVILHSY
jgi:hypothetical protein